MSVGFTVTKPTIDGNAGNLSQQIETWSGQVLSFQDYLTAATEEELEALGYTADDVALLKSSFNDLSLLARIYQGEDVLAEARDLGTFSRRLAGLIL